MAPLGMVDWPYMVLHAVLVRQLRLEQLILIFFLIYCKFWNLNKNEVTFFPVSVWTSVGTISMKYWKFIKSAKVAVSHFISLTYVTFQQFPHLCRWAFRRPPTAGWSRHGRHRNWASRSCWNVENVNLSHNWQHFNNNWRRFIFLSELQRINFFPTCARNYNQRFPWTRSCERAHPLSGAPGNL